MRAKQGSSPETVSLPADLQSIKRAGMLVGPAAYALSRLAERRPRRLPAAPGAVDGRRTPVELMLRPDGHAVQVVTFRDRDVARPPSAPGWRPRPSARRPAAISWGATPALMLIAAFGLALVAVADALSRSGAGDGRPLFWAGVAAMVTPIAYRLASENIPRGERVALLTVFGLALYGVKLLRDPFAFTYADELVHVANVDAILRTGHLLTANSILPVTPLYPGLESVTAALASMTGLSAFAASAVTIGIARVLLTLGLYLFVEKLTGSARTGGLAALFYAAAPNYVFFIGQYSYESLGLPLACVALFAFARALRAATSSDSLRWSVVFVLLTAAIVVTHHMTTYALVAFLVAVAALTAVLRGVRPRWSPWILAGAAAVLTTVWLLSFADRTYAYLAPVIRGAIRGTFATVSGETAPRALFRPEAGPPAPPWERAVAIASVLALVLIMPFGLRTVWTRFRRSPMVLALAAAGMLYGATLPLRLVPRAWETASRASEFLFVGVAVVVALAGIERWRTDRVPSVGRWLVAAAAALLVSGGIMIGSPSAQRLAQSYRIERGGEAIDPQGVTAAQWVGSNLGPGNRFAAEQSDARLLQAYGRQFAIAGTYPDVVDILHARLLEPWMLQLLAEQRIRYVDVNRLKASANSGLYFFSPPGAWTAALFPGAVVSKFDRDARVDRLFDSGDVAIYDVGRLTGGRPPR